MASFLSIDRIENDIAACEMDDRSMKMIPLSVLPPEVREGDVIYEHAGRYMLDRDETQRRREENIRLMKILRGDSGSGLNSGETGFAINKPEEPDK